MVAYALRLSTCPTGDDPVTVGLFASPVGAADHFHGREDLHGYFWSVGQPVEVEDGTELPRIEWTPDRVAAAHAEHGDR